ncbi:hypothetical protein [Hyphomonas sp.]|uniref:hypothetical protein n=1 Tax=Hyphomonas sp. TaxID=87 RepID=UPI0025B9099D|nr:hypothetical protein [Hyphomonas sp.]
MTRTELLSSKDFQGAEIPGASFTLPSASIAIGTKTLEKVSLIGRYDSHGQVYLEADNPNGLQGFIEASQQNARCSSPCFPKPVELIPIEVNMEKFTFFPTRQPMQLNFGNSATKVEAALLNGPDLSHAGGEILIERGSKSLRLHDNPEVQSMSKNRSTDKSHRYQRLVTNFVTIEGDNISSEEALLFLTQLSNVLTLVRGGYSGFGNICGYDHNENLTFAHLGFFSSDHFAIPNGWCSGKIVRELPTIFNLYHGLENLADRQVLKRTVEFYRASNVSREHSLEVALVASFAGLEAIVPHLLRTQGGWSEQLLRSKIPFSDLLRAAIALIGLDGNPMEHLNDFEKRAASDANKDACTMLSKFRNNTIHYKSGFDRTGREVLEAWELAQWLCELMMIYLINYRSVMTDRRKYSGWIGDNEVDVPIRNSPIGH